METLKNRYYIVIFSSTLLSFCPIDLHLCKYVVGTKCIHLSYLFYLKAQVRFHLLHYGKLIKPVVACNGCSGYTALISPAESCACLSYNEKRKFCLFGKLFVWDFC